MKGIYRFKCDCGRMGELSGIFVADSADVEKLIGSNAYFGEVLGKHSEIEGEIEENEIELVTDNANCVEMFEFFSLATGYNPFEYLRGDDE
jgi:hypothetical protein